MVISISVVKFNPLNDRSKKEEPIWDASPDITVGWKV